MALPASNPVHDFHEDVGSPSTKFTFNLHTDAPHTLEWIDVGDMLTSFNFLFQEYEIPDITYKYVLANYIFATGTLSRGEESPVIEN